MLRVLLVSSQETENSERNATSIDQILFASGDGSDSRVGNVARVPSTSVTHVTSRGEAMRTLQRKCPGSATGEPPFHVIVSKLGKQHNRSEADLCDNGAHLIKQVKQNTLLDSCLGGGDIHAEQNDDDRSMDTQHLEGERIFCVILSHTACESAKMRTSLSRDYLVNMVTSGHTDLAVVLKMISSHWKEVRSVARRAASLASEAEEIQKCDPEDGDKKGFHCPKCRFGPLSAESLLQHYPLFHVREKNVPCRCPICGLRCTDRHPFAPHLRNAHGSAGHEDAPMKLYAFALVVCRHPVERNKFLVVDEFCGVGYWLPGGQVDNGERLQDAAIRETQEEAGVLVDLKGILSMQYSTHKWYSRLRVVFYAELVQTDPPQRPKTIPDYESAGATWLKTSDLDKVKLRGSEPRKWFRYVTEGGIIYPLDILRDTEG